MTSELISAGVALLLGACGFILNTNVENKGIRYHIIRNFIWFLAIVSVLAAIAFYIYGNAKDLFVAYIIVTLIAANIILGIFSCVYYYKYYPFSNSSRPNTSSTGGVIAFNSNKDYNDIINPLEEKAQEIITLTKRLNIAFKPEELIKEIATQRFGQSSFEQTERNNYNIYVQAHERRRRAFFSYLASGKEYYEIYCGSELKKYIETFYHNGTDNLDRQYLSKQIHNWIKTIQQYPNYHVIICCKEGVAIPLKYKIYDRKYVVMHDSVGKHPQNRVNAFMITETEAVAKFVTDFETIWNLSEHQNQNSASTCTWIQTNLIDPFIGGQKS